jgi:biopolymer transport protein ExbB/TolQ
MNKYDIVSLMAAGFGLVVGIISFIFYFLQRRAEKRK